MDNMKSKSYTVQNISTLLIYMIIMSSVFWFCSTLGDYENISTLSNLDESAKSEKYGYLSFIGYWQLHWLALVVLILSVFFTSLFYTKYKEYVSIVLENKLFGHSITVQVLTVISLVLGIYASVTSASILSWLSPENNQIGMANFGVEYIIFLFILVFISLVKYGIVTSRLLTTEKAEQKTFVAEIETKQTERVDELERVIRLAPPGNFPSQFADYADILEDFATTKVLQNTIAFEALPPEKKTLQKWTEIVKEQQNYIRASLIAFARLAGTYDNAALGPSSPLEYRANLMFKVKDPELLKILQKDKNHDKRFFLGHGSSPTYQLILSREYSVLVSNEDETLVSDTDNQIDYKIKTFPDDNAVADAIFPVYLDAEENDTVHNMFGAPKAISTCHPQFIVNTKNSANSLHQKGMSGPIVKEAIDYFTGEKKGRSIISLPISHQRFLQSSLKPENMVGVLNIYRNKADLFSKDTEKFNNFSYLTLPLQISLSRIVHFHLMTLKEKPVFIEEKTSKKEEAEINP